jgi:hypothetical protein
MSLGPGGAWVRTRSSLRSAPAAWARFGALATRVSSAMSLSKFCRRIAKVVKGDIETSNGVIHVIDSVILPSM